MDNTSGSNSNLNLNQDQDSVPIDPEERQRMEEELKSELAKTEEEISTLRQVLANRINHAQELKRKLGIGVWKELQNDLQQSIKNVQETTAYQKTSETVRFAAEKTTDIFGSLSDTIGRKLVNVKKSNAFKSFEEKVGSTLGKTGLSQNNNDSTSNEMPPPDIAKEANASSN